MATKPLDVDEEGVEEGGAGVGPTRMRRFSLALSEEEYQTMRVMAQARNVPSVAKLIRRYGVEEPLAAATALVAQLGERLRP